MKKLKGLLKISRYGFGIIISKKITKRIRVDKKDLNLNFDNSEVEFEILKETDKTIYAKITSLPDFKNRIFVGIVHHFFKNDIITFCKRLGSSNLVLCKSKILVNQNDFVKFKIKKIKNKKFYGKIIENFGNFFDDEALTKYLVELNDLPKDFSKKVLLKANKCVNRYHQEFETESRNRTNLVNLNTFTIDPPSARDLDDAITIIKNDKGFKLYVHIADVTYFIKRGNSIDVEAQKRSFSVYLPKTVIRMLPPILSEKYCSLLPNENKYAVTTEIDLDLKGNVINSKIYKSIIESKKKYSYQEVYDIITKNLDDQFKVELDWLKELSELLRKERLKLPELYYSEKDISLRYSDFSHSMIEEMMILNNIIAAKTLSDNDISYPARYHPSPSLEKNLNTIDILSYLNNINVSPNIQCLQKIINTDNKQLKFINMLGIQRMLTKATYDCVNSGHWALNLLYYSHFTSPIRRMPDIISHRLIFGNKYKDENLNKILENVNQNEKKYQNINHLMEKIKVIKFCKLNNMEGKEFDILVLDVNNPTIDIFVIELFYMCKIHISDLYDTVMHFDNEKKIFINENNILKIGDLKKIKLVRINIPLFELIFKKNC